jgi:hypothetical protein
VCEGGPGFTRARPAAWAGGGVEDGFSGGAGGLGVDVDFFPENRGRRGFAGPAGDRPLRGVTDGGNGGAC